MKQKGMLTIIVTDETLITPLRCFSGKVSSYKEINDTIREITNNGAAYYQVWLETATKTELVDSNPEQHVS